MKEGITNIPITSGAPQKPAPEKKAKTSWRKVQNNLRPILWVVVIIALAGLSYGYIHTRHQLDKANSPQASQDATKDLVSKVGKLVVLPPSESPTTATVNDSSKLKNQQFFSKAQNGDKVLIYSKSGQAVLYRPSVNKVVVYTQITFDNNTSP